MKKKLLPVLLMFCLTGCSFLNKEPEVVEEAPVEASTGMSFQHNPGVMLEGDTHEKESQSPQSVAKTASAQETPQQEVTEQPVEPAAPIIEQPEEPQQMIPQAQGDTAQGSVYSLGQRLLVLAVQREPKNIMISPVSVERAMSMAAQGAKDKTWQEILDTVYGAYDYTNVLTDMYQPRSYYEAPDEEGNGETYFAMANSIWANADKDIEFSDHYIDVLTDNFLADAYSVPFTDAETVDDMNSWISDKTHEQITHLFDELSPEGDVVLINTVAFKDSWVEPFNVEQDPYSFFNAQGKETKATQLITADAVYCSMAGHQAFVKPYSHKMKFIGILPNEEESLVDTIKSVSYDDLADIQYPGYDLTLIFPRFQADYQTSLVKDLQTLGIKKAFSSEADFSDMCNAKPVISDVIHKTHIALDEDGTEAAAATAIMMNDTMAADTPRKHIELYFNRPFYYIIADVNNVPIFMGVTTDAELYQ